MGSWQQEGQKAEAAGRGRLGVGVHRHIQHREKGHRKKANLETGLGRKEGNVSKCTESMMAES